MLELYNGINAIHLGVLGSFFWGGVIVLFKLVPCFGLSLSVPCRGVRISKREDNLNAFGKSFVSNLLLCCFRGMSRDDNRPA